MELTMTNSFGFCELNENEMMVVDGGAITTDFCKATVSITVGAAASYGVAKLGVSIGGKVGAVIGGPLGMLAGGAIGYVAGNIIADILID